MNSRVSKLREQIQVAPAELSSERALLMTEFYSSAEADKHPNVVSKALAFKHYMENRTIAIAPSELIVGMSSVSVNAVETYPEQSAFTISDLQYLATAGEVDIIIPPNVSQLYRDQIYPFWQERSLRKIARLEMSEDWNAAFNCGIFSDYMTQRAPGSPTLDNKIFKLGFLDLRKKIISHQVDLDYVEDSKASVRHHEYEAMLISIDAIVNFAKRYANLARNLANEASDSVRKAELLKIAEVCEHVPEHKPRDFYDSLQMAWFVVLATQAELEAWNSLNLGRLDQNLIGCYRQDVGAGVLDENKARELLQCFAIKLEQINQLTKPDYNFNHSDVFADFSPINIGGSDELEHDCANELSILILESIEELKLRNVHCCAQLSFHNSDEFLYKAANNINTPTAQASCLNFEKFQQGLVEMGIEPEDLFQTGLAGLDEKVAFGKHFFNQTGVINLHKIFLLTMHRGKDPASNEQIGIDTGDIANFNSFEEFISAFHEQVQYFVDLKIAGDNKIHQIYSDKLPRPFLSLITENCITEGADFMSAGSRYRTCMIQAVGVETVTQAMLALKYHLFDKGELCSHELLEAFTGDYADEEEFIEALEEDTPEYLSICKYENEIADTVLNAYKSSVEDRRNIFGAPYIAAILPITVNLFFGEQAEKIVNGTGEHLEHLEGDIPPRDEEMLKRFKAVVKSAAELDSQQDGAMILNLNFDKEKLNAQSADDVRHLLRSYFALGGHFAQFNLCNEETIFQAKQAWLSQQK